MHAMDGSAIRRNTRNFGVNHEIRRPRMEQRTNASRCVIWMASTIELPLRVVLVAGVHARGCCRWPGACGIRGLLLFSSRDPATDAGADASAL